jgi:L-asparaginase/Glu-tRNA(Gln) amidotransferase subunit D
LVWDPQPDLENAVASFKEAEYQSHVHDFLHKSIWNNDLEGSLRQLFKQLNVNPENRNAAIKCIKQNGLAEARTMMPDLPEVDAQRLSQLYLQNARGLHVKKYFEVEKSKRAASSHPPSLGLRVTVESLEKTIDSSDCNPAKWNELANVIIDRRKRGFSAFVVIHGTDTLSYTAAALSFILENFDLPVVITGSQVPWIKKGVLCDAQNNLIGAVLSASWRFGTLPEELQKKANGHYWSAVDQYFRKRSEDREVHEDEAALIARDALKGEIAKVQEWRWKTNPLEKIPTRTPLRGVYVFFDNKLMLGTRVVKSSSTSFDAFSSANAMILGSKSGGGDVQIAVKAFVEREIFDAALRSEDDVLIAFRSPRYCRPVQVVDPTCRVQVIKLFPGFVLDSISFKRTIGMVFVTFGTGNGPNFGQSLFDLAERIPVVYVSECLAGGTTDTYATSFKAANPGTIRLHDASIEAAYTKLCCVLSSVINDLSWPDEDTAVFPGPALKRIKRLMKRPVAAEFGEGSYGASSDKARMNF